jgi:hypothetical protein
MNACVKTYRFSLTLLWPLSRGADVLGSRVLRLSIDILRSRRFEVSPAAPFEELNFRFRQEQWAANLGSVGAAGPTI